MSVVVVDVVVVVVDVVVDPPTTRPALAVVVLAHAPVQMGGTLHWQMIPSVWLEGAEPPAAVTMGLP